MKIFVIHTNADGSKAFRSYEGMSLDTVQELSAAYKTAFDVVDENTYMAALPPPAPGAQ